MRHFTARELDAHLQNAQAAPLLLDVREPWEFATCHIAGSRLVPMRAIADTLAELDPARETVVICHHGIRSRAAGAFLERQGFSNIINLSGGVDAWAREVDRAMPVY
jgi:rhodanese-related sulfurtransferase